MPFPGLHGPFTVFINIANKQAPNHVELNVPHSGKGGTVDATCKIDLADEAGGSVLTYHAEAKLEASAEVCPPKGLHIKLEIPRDNESMYSPSSQAMPSAAAAPSAADLAGHASGCVPDQAQHPSRLPSQRAEPAGNLSPNTERNDEGLISLDAATASHNADNSHKSAELGQQVGSYRGISPAADLLEAAELARADRGGNLSTPAPDAMHVHAGQIEDADSHAASDGDGDEDNEEKRMTTRSRRQRGRDHFMLNAGNVPVAQVVKVDPLPSAHPPADFAVITT